MANAEGSSPALSTRAMPMPPPPAAALSMTGYPISQATRSASTAWAVVSWLPGTTGTPALSRRASVSSPIRRIASGDGPTKVRPAR